MVEVNTSVAHHNIGRGRFGQRLDEDYTYFWRVEYVNGDRKAISDKWRFSTAGRIMLKVDLALPMGDGVPYLATAKLT